MNGSMNRNREYTFWRKQVEGGYLLKILPVVNSYKGPKASPSPNAHNNSSTGIFHTNKPDIFLSAHHFVIASGNKLRKITYEMRKHKAMRHPLTTLSTNRSRLKKSIVRAIIRNNTKLS